MAELRNGYTTGTCAAIAAKAALKMLLSGKTTEKESIITPSGEEIETEIHEPVLSEGAVSCAVKKDAGDDPDVTDGMLIFASVSLINEREIRIEGGEGVGRVTKPGLSLKVGEAAINPVPREMIRNAVLEAADEYGYEGGLVITISVPGGEKIAEKTFNPRLGIEGGISILGSTGIVKPMSEEAIIETVKLEIDMRKAAGSKRLFITPGNYGMDFLYKEYGIDKKEPVLCSNYPGEALSHAYEKGFRDIVLAGHFGKMVKLAGGIMNTHSRNADCRMEIIAANAVYFTDDTEVIRSLTRCITTDEAAGILKDNGILDDVMGRITEKALYYLMKRVGDPEDLKAELIIYSNEYGVLGKGTV